MRRLLVLVCIFRGDVWGDWTPAVVTFIDGSQVPIRLRRCSRCGRKLDWSPVPD